MTKNRPSTLGFSFNQKVTVHVEKVTVHVDIAYRRLERTFAKKQHFLPKSYSTVIDILHISEDTDNRHINRYEQIDMGDEKCTTIN